MGLLCFNDIFIFKKNIKMQSLKGFDDKRNLQGAYNAPSKIPNLNGAYYAPCAKYFHFYLKRFFKMKKFLLFPLMAILANNAYANSSIDTVKQIVALAENGEIFNLNKTAESLNLKDEIDKATYKPLADGNHIIYNFSINTHQVIKSISYRVSFGGLGNYDLTTVYKNVSIEFKSEHCSSVDDLQTAFGEKLMATEAMGSPSLQTGQNGYRQGVRYMMYHIRTSNQLIFVENHGCEFSVLGRADEFK